MKIVDRFAHRANWSARGALDRITAIILHDTEAKTAESTLRWFENPAAQVSSHYVIDRDGTVYRCVSEKDKAWHAGISALWGEDNLNKVSIGIELVDADDTEGYPDPQYQALVELTADIVRRYRIPLNRVVTHSAVSVPQGRKKDPGPDFPLYDFLLAVAARTVR